jgi:micrococcal nuclease
MAAIMKFLPCLALVWWGFSPTAIAETLPAKVISVGDGDTITVNQSGKKTVVRLGCIDSPELAQTPYGESARQHLQTLLPSGTPVQLRMIDRDRYGRTVAEVFKEADSINLAMVQAGQAVVYWQYFAGCRSSQQAYEQAELQAKQEKHGFWQQNQPVMPWAFRRGQTAPALRAKSGSAAGSTACNPSYPDLCLPPNGPDLDCRDISGRRFRVLPPDPYGFDRDRDGIGCEG